MKIELRGLELFGHHGVTEEERERGQLFLYDVELEVGERGANDRIEDAVDYREVAATVRRIADGRFALLEALATTIADALFEIRARTRDRPRPQPEVRPAGSTSFRRRRPPSARDAPSDVRAFRRGHGRVLWRPRTGYGSAVGQMPRAAERLARRGFHDQRDRAVGPRSISRRS